MVHQKEIKQTQREKKQLPQKVDEPERVWKAIREREYGRPKDERLKWKIRNTLCSKLDKQCHGRELNANFCFKTEEISVENALVTLKFDKNKTNAVFLNEFFDRNFWNYFE